MKASEWKSRLKSVKRAKRIADQNHEQAWQALMTGRHFEHCARYASYPLVSAYESLAFHHQALAHHFLAIAMHNYKVAITRAWRFKVCSCAAGKERFAFCEGDDYSKAETLKSDLEAHVARIETRMEERMVGNV